ncbi:MAG: DNA methyltransferase [Tepidisphaeraceae bacterium]
MTDDSVDLIYLDPPFKSDRVYNVLFERKTGADVQAQIEAFDDTWTWSQQSEQQYKELVAGGGAPPLVADTIEGMHKLLGETDMLAYLVMMTPRLIELHRVLKPTGSLYLHCDPTASSYLRLILDAVFGHDNFQNEIIWYYRGGGVSKTRFGRRHDVIFFYTKGHTWTFNADAVRTPYSKESLERLRYKARSFRGAKVYDAYEANVKGKHPDDVFIMQPIMPSAKERLGYPTQKPRRLLKRIIAASSNPGDVILDPFCGCGTAIEAAQALDRQWIGIDITYIAVDLTVKRLRHVFGDDITKTFDVDGIPRDMGGAQALFKRSPFDFERWAVSLVEGTPNQRQVGDKGIDGFVKFSIDNKAGTGRALVSVKGGAVNPGHVRDLIGTIDTQKAEMGILISMDAPTRGIRDAIGHSGTYTYPINGRTYPKVQVLTIEELLDGRRPDMPTPLLPYIKAERAAPGTQLTLAPTGTVDDEGADEGDELIDDEDDEAADDDEGEDADNVAPVREYIKPATYAKATPESAVPTEGAPVAGKGRRRGSRRRGGRGGGGGPTPAP